MSALLQRGPERLNHSPPNRSVSTWDRTQRILVYCAWQAVSKLFLGVIYLAVISEGLRVLIPALGQKLYKLPGLSSLQDYEATHRLDLAPFFAVFLLVAVFVLWHRIVELWLSGEEFSRLAKEHQLVVGMGCMILGADAVLFYLAMTQMTWGGGGLSFSALVATGAYVGVLIFVSWMSVILHPKRKA